MTATAAQLRKVFGKSAVWELLTLIRQTHRPAWPAGRDDRQPAGLRARRHHAQDASGGARDKTGAADPLPILRRAFFDHRAGRPGDHVAGDAARPRTGIFALCGDCAAGGNREARMRARLGTQETL